jgi:phage portal protein BeeE
LGLKHYFKNFFPIQEKKSNNNLSGFNNQDFQNLLRIGSSHGVTSTEAYNIYNYNSVVSDAIDQIVSKVIGLKPVIKDNDGSITKEHDILTFLRKPNCLQTYDDFMESAATNFLINKNSYVSILGNIKKEPTELWSLKNTWVNISESSNSAIFQVTVKGLYQFLQNQYVLNLDPRTNPLIKGRIVTKNELAELLHIKGFSLSKGTLESVSYLSSLEREARLVEQANHHNLNLLERGFWPIIRRYYR